MAKYEVTTSWNAGLALSAKTVVQARGGRVYLGTGTAPSGYDAPFLMDGQALEFASGVDLFYRTDNPTGPVYILTVATA